MKKIAALSLVVLSVLSCSKKKIIEPVDAVVENIYATSIKLPASKNGPYQLFDDNSKGFWVTSPGTGPDEGVFVQFEEPIFIKKVEVDAVAESFSSYRLYINGVETKDYESSQKSVDINKQVRTFYLRIIDNSVFEDDQSVSVKNISFYNDQEKKMILALPEIEPGSVKASSSLAPVESYSVDFLFDSRKDFGWADGDSESDGTGEYIVFNFDEEVTIDSLKIWNGYQRSDEHYKANERVEKFSFGITGEDVSSYELHDYDIQKVDLKETLTAKSFTLKIDSVYSGSKYKDLVISELRFLNGGRPFILDSGGLEKLQKKNLETKAGNDLYKKLIDRRFLLTVSEPDNYTYQSLILRSNGSFVLWFVSEDTGVSRSRYADGNWQIESDGRVKIFGRIHNIENYYNTDEEYDPYGGGSEEDVEPVKKDFDSIKIFHDYISLTSDSLKSERRLFKPFKLQ
ncbi:MAG: hypothetical protein JXK07_03980 [Spirochaetes bacterium]|nr:hypothetical protein [Spirochaetota bacterium]MBN2770354.1 hypothetical protein [Spirochaetota bacterium]